MVHLQKNSINRPTGLRNGVIWFGVQFLFWHWPMFRYLTGTIPPRSESGTLCMDDHCEEMDGLPVWVDILEICPIEWPIGMFFCSCFGLIQGQKPKVADGTYRLTLGLGWLILTTVTTFRCEISTFCQVFNTEKKPLVMSWQSTRLLSVNLRFGKGSRLGGNRHVVLRSVLFSRVFDTPCPSTSTLHGSVGSMKQRWGRGWDFLGGGGVWCQVSGPKNRTIKMGWILRKTNSEDGGSQKLCCVNLSNT